MLAIAMFSMAAHLHRMVGWRRHWSWRRRSRSRHCGNSAGGLALAHLRVLQSLMLDLAASAGVGEAAIAYGIGGTAAAGMTKDLAQAFVLGKDPFRIEERWTEMYDHVPSCGQKSGLNLQRQETSGPPFRRNHESPRSATPALGGGPYHFLKEARGGRHHLLGQELIQLRILFLQRLKPLGFEIRSGSASRLEGR
jgi:hypothetical protein